eukprot:TRINITY_DN37170_c0_g1_i1.p1 TRINITY_DN37170_c0_g1~~TRINITY_DN37170_c0_g1_i1.p1  ORF type:complete len:447 (+),score=83.35 TRINITY_DN37170_c0_g1_i1:156-1343(+)
MGEESQLPAGLGKRLIDSSMMADVRTAASSKRYKVLPWLKRPSGSVGYAESRAALDSLEQTFYIYKDEDETVTPGTQVEETAEGFVACGDTFKLDNVISAADLARREIDLLSSEFEWFAQLKKARTPQSGSKPWVIVLMGVPGCGKTTFLASDRAEHGAVQEALGCEIPFDNLVFKQLDDVIHYGATEELHRLWAAAKLAKDPYEKFRHYWANKQHLFTRFVLDKPSKDEHNPNPQSYEFRVGARIVEALTKPEAQYNIAMETTGLSPALVKFGLTAPHYDNYNKLILLLEIDDVNKAKLVTHSRLIKEMNTCKMYGGEQFGDYLEVIHNKARETFLVCQDLARAKNEELDNAGSPCGRWYCHKVARRWSVELEHHKRIDAFYKGQNWDEPAGKT